MALIVSPLEPLVTVVQVAEPAMRRFQALAVMVETNIGPLRPCAPQGVSCSEVSPAHEGLSVLVRCIVQAGEGQIAVDTGDEGNTVGIIHQRETGACLCHCMCSLCFVAGQVDLTEEGPYARRSLRFLISTLLWAIAFDEVFHRPSSNGVGTEALPLETRGNPALR